MSKRMTFDVCAVTVVGVERSCLSRPLQRFSHVCRRRASARRSAGLKAGRYTDVKRALAHPAYPA